MPKPRASWRVAFLVATGHLSDGPVSRHGPCAITIADKLSSGVLDFVYAENRIAFGSCRKAAPSAAGFFGGGRTANIVSMSVPAPRCDDRVLGACALLLAGILGNLTDRVRLGFVIDFIMLHAGQYHWPTFNVADASICIGAVLLAYDLIFAYRKTKETTRPRPLTTDS
jgi:signal peptidase II